MAAGMAPRFLLLAVSLLLGGCATLNKGECQTVDWHEPVSYTHLTLPTILRV